MIRCIASKFILLISKVMLVGGYISASRSVSAEFCPPDK